MDGTDTKAVANPNVLVHSSRNSLVKDKNEIEHPAIESTTNKNRSNDGVLVVTSAVVEHQSRSQSASGESIGSNSG